MSLLVQPGIPGHLCNPGPLSRPCREGCWGPRSVLSRTGNWTWQPVAQEDTLSPPPPLLCSDASGNVVPFLVLFALWRPRSLLSYFLIIEVEKYSRTVSLTCEVSLGLVLSRAVLLSPPQSLASQTPGPTCSAQDLGEPYLEPKGHGEGVSAWPSCFP